MWAEEGLAEYLGETLFTGDGFEVELIPQSRLGRLREMLKDGRAVPLPATQAGSVGQSCFNLSSRNAK